MRRHIVVAFERVSVIGFAFADQAVEHGGHVGAHVRVGVFVDRQGRRKCAAGTGGATPRGAAEAVAREFRRLPDGNRADRGRNENSVCDTIGQERFMIVFSRGRRVPFLSAVFLRGREISVGAYANVSPDGNLSAKLTLYSGNAAGLRGFRSRLRRNPCGKCG